MISNAKEPSSASLAPRPARGDDGRPQDSGRRPRKEVTALEQRLAELERRLAELLGGTRA